MKKVDKSRVCAVCGADISDRGAQARYCVKCARLKIIERAAAHQWLMKSNDRPKTRAEIRAESFAEKEKRLTRINAQARKLDMSYGQYVAMMGWGCVG